MKKDKHKIIKRAVVCAVMFSMGVSAFAQGNSLFNKNREPNMSAVNDMFHIMELQQDAKRDGVVTSAEQQEINKSIQNYNISYGKNAYSDVNEGIDAFFRSRDGAELLVKWKVGNIGSDVALKRAIYKGISTSSKSKLANYEIER